MLKFQYFRMIITVIILFQIQQGSSLYCIPGSYEVRTIDPNKTFCDDCGRKNILTPCATVRCANETECKLVYQSSTDIADCAYGKVPLRPTCTLKCKGRTKCPVGSVTVQSVGGCKDCYSSGPQDNFTNPCKAKGACDASQTCSLYQVECFTTTPCYPLKKCCPNDICQTNSLRYTDSNGCKRCYACNECIKKKCNMFEKCILEEVQCKQCPCPPRAKCVSKIS